MAQTPLGTYRLASGRTISQLGERFGVAAETSLGKQLYKEGQGILAESVGLVPVDTGALRSSGYVTEPSKDGNTITVDIGYGGPAAKINSKTGESTDSYALFVHENLDAFHKVGSAKYLEMPFDQAKPGMAERVADGMRQDLEGTGTGPDEEVKE